MERAPGTRGSNAFISVNEAPFHPLWTMIINWGSLYTLSVAMVSIGFPTMKIIRNYTSI